jgi:hypothetical protein
VQQQDVRRNYISIVSDAIEHERSAGTAARSQPETMKDFVGRLTAVLKRRLPRPTVTSQRTLRPSAESVAVCVHLDGMREP